MMGMLVLAVPLTFLAVLWFSLPSIDALHKRAQVTSTKIVDRRGQLLYEVIDPRVGHHIPVELDLIPLRLRQATIAVEDASFYANPGVDLAGIARAIWINMQGGDVLAGGSTITQQLARTLLLEPEERMQRSLIRKLRESMLAWQIAQKYSKDEVLTLYLNEIYYGNLAYGVDSASKAYFNKSVTELDLAESALLAGLPQSPVAYDPLNNPDAAKKRQQVVLDLMVRNGVIGADDADVARQARLSYAPQPYPIKAPHFVAYVRMWLEEHFGDEMLLRGGLIVTTTLDLTLNVNGESIIRERLDQLQQQSANAPAHNAKNAGLVAIDARTGEIVAMIGSPDYFDASISGAVNSVVALRQPGSAIKPITYAAAFERVPGFTAGTPIFDVRMSFPTREGLPYIPENYDGQHHGPVSVREALATSNNIAAVRVLQAVGLDNMLGLANAMGIHSFQDAENYGLALTLGGGEVRLLELTAAYGVFANSGRRLEPFAVLSVSNQHGELLYQSGNMHTDSQVIDPRIAWLITDILSDNSARASAFGQNSVLRLSRPAAVKTGTTTDWRDNWTVGYTPDLVVGVWVGNADNEPMVRISGVSGAGPIWHDFMEVAFQGKTMTAFDHLNGLKQISICSLSGMLPTPECSYTRNEWYVAGTEPTATDTWFVRQKTDISTGKVVDNSTPIERVVERVVLRLPVELREWALEQGWPLYSEVNTVGDACKEGILGPCDAIVIAQPDNGGLYRITNRLPRQSQRIPLSVRVMRRDGEYAEVILDEHQVIAHFDTDQYNGFWVLQKGIHTFQARLYYKDGHIESSPLVTIHVEE